MNEKYFYDLHQDVFIARGRREFLERWRRCPIVNLCLWCPANSYLETGEMATPIDCFCQIASARAAAIRGG